MNWDQIDSTVREAFRKNGRDVSIHRGRTPLSDLIAKDKLPDLDGMTEVQLCECAADHHVAIAEGLTREQMIEAIKNALEVNWDERLRGMRGTLDYIFADGPHPLAVIRRAYAIAKAVRPECILSMSCAQLAVLCDDGRGRSSDGRATVSARIDRIFSEPIRKAGMRGFKAPFQKNQSASENYSVSARGNQNRLGRDFLQQNKPNDEKGKAA